MGIFFRDTLYRLLYDVVKKYFQYVSEARSRVANDLLMRIELNACAS